MDRGRDWRRYQNILKEKKVYKKLRDFSSDGGLDDKTESMKEDRLKSRLLRDNLKNCSCHMCGNPRKHWNELTFQERKLKEKNIDIEYY